MNIPGTLRESHHGSVHRLKRFVLSEVIAPECNAESGNWRAHRIADHIQHSGGLAALDPVVLERHVPIRIAIVSTPSAGEGSRTHANHILIPGRCPVAPESVLRHVNALWPHARHSIRRAHNVQGRSILSRLEVTIKDLHSMLTRYVEDGALQQPETCVDELAALDTREGFVAGAPVIKIPAVEVDSIAVVGEVAVFDRQTHAALSVAHSSVDVQQETLAQNQLGQLAAIASQDSHSNSTPQKRGGVKQETGVVVHEPRVLGEQVQAGGEVLDLGIHQERRPARGHVGVGIQASLRRARRSKKRHGPCLQKLATLKAEEGLIPV